MFKRKKKRLSQQIENLEERLTLTYDAFNEAKITIGEFVDIIRIAKFNEMYEELLTQSVRLREMMNEFKGCISLSRAALQDRKNHDYKMLYEVKDRFSSLDDKLSKFMDRIREETPDNPNV